MGAGYHGTPLLHTEASLVDVGDGRVFMVVAYSLVGDAERTVVFERQERPECWVSRREIACRVEPLAAVTGLLLGPPSPDPVGDLKRSLAIERRTNWDLRHEIENLKERIAAAGPAKERGGRRGRRNP